MACPIVNLRTDLLYSAQDGGTWTYNGYSSTFDGDDDNLAQFVESPASAPEEFSTLAGDNPTFDPTGHTVGFYSLTYTLTDGGCSAENNIVIPIAQTYYAGIDRTKSTCNGDASIFNLFDLISDFGNEADVDDQGYWMQLNGTPNPHPGFYNPTDPTLATFDVSEINYPSDTFPLEFYYTTQEPAVAGFTQTRCPQCSADHSLVRLTYYTVVGGCCDDSGNCYEAEVPDGTTFYLMLLNAGSVSNSSDAMNFPYTLPADNTAFEDDLNNYLTNNGGGTATVTAGVGSTTIAINNPCVGFNRVCLNEGCSSYISFTSGTC